MKILLVEDDLDVAQSIAEFLEYNNLSVDFAYDVQQAKHLLNQTTFDVIVMDINLPDGNGITLCEQLHTEHNVKQPILILSARASEKDKLAAFESGAVDFVTKPFSMRELLARINNISKHFVSNERFEERLGGLSICLRTGYASYNGDLVQLHKTHFKILHALITNFPHPISSERLTNIIWGEEAPESNPLRSHISRINSSFKNSVGSKLIKSIRGIGYKISLNEQNDQ